MPIQQQLLDPGALFNVSDTQNIPVEWAAGSLNVSALASIRRRRMPSGQVLRLVLGIALFRDEPVHEVARRLIFALKTWHPTPRDRNRVAVRDKSVHRLLRCARHGC